MMEQKRLFGLVLTITLILLLAGPLAAARKVGDGSESPTPRLAQERIQDTLISWQPNRPFERIQLVVAGTDGIVFEGEFEAGSPLIFDFLDQEGAPLADGLYRYELRATPVIDPSVRDLMAAARDSGDPSIARELRSSGVLPDPESLVMSGTFRLTDGLAVNPELPEDQIRKENPGSRYLQGRSATPQDFVINDDLIVDGSACIGFDCVNGEVFSFDTIRLKENNLRIKFDDTSTVPSFPANDWQLTANESANGGQSKFSIEDISGSRTPFTIEANARSHSLYVDDGGRIGSRTSTPSVEIHTIDGDTPTLRLQQDGSSGFEPQTWDVAGNETNFFIRDVTNGSTLPFRIRPGAPSNAIFVDVDGDVGMGTSSPEAALHVRRTSAQAAIHVDDENNGTGAQIIIQDSGTGATNKPGFIIRSADAASSGDWAFETDSGGNFQIDFRPSSGPELLITDATTMNGSTIQLNGNVTIAGSLTKGSGAFKIDHPLDPENKYLIHSFVESPDMMNIYNGNAVLDDNGEARVVLPEWFEVLNREFRYQLTSIGAPNPGLYIAEKISGNQFKIAGGQPGSEVSWMVTGVRQDPYANANRLQVEEDKPEELRGSYLHPEAYKKLRAQKKVVKQEADRP